MPELQMTDRIIKALEHPMVTMLAHPTGRLLLSREPYKIDMSRILNTAAVHRKVLELNSNPHRLDIDWRCCKQAKKKGVMIAINPDAHHTSGLHDVRYGIDQARKGWIEASDCLNTLSLESIRSIFWKKYF
jgi:DNA polymerase (family 10)